MTDEVWLPIPGYNGGYAVTIAGDVWSCKSGEWKKLKPSISRGYRSVSLSVPGDRKRRKIASLVCEAFHGAKPADKQLVRHLDGNSLHDHADNLAWGTYRENNLDAVRHGTSPAARNGRASVPKRSGALCHRARMTWEQVREIRALRATGVGVADLAETYKLDPSAVSAICLGRAWKEPGAVVTGGRIAKQRPYGTGPQAKGLRNLKARARAAQMEA